MNNHMNSSYQNGVFLVLISVLFPSLMLLMALIINVPYVQMVRSELQIAADAGAMRGAKAVYEGDPDPVSLAIDAVQKNTVWRQNIANDEINVRIGEWKPSSREFDVTSLTPNAVEVMVVHSGLYLLNTPIPGNVYTITRRSIAWDKDGEIKLVDL